MPALKPSKTRKPVAQKLVEAPPPAQSEASPAVAARKPPTGKLGQLIALLSRPEGATISQMMDLTSWQSHSVRGALAGTLKKKFGLAISSEKTGPERVYRITADAA